MNPTMSFKGVSFNTVPPAGALAHVPEAGVLTATDDALLDELYVAVTVVAPAATPVTATTAVVCPAGTVTVAGTVALVGSELTMATLAALAGADDSVTVNGAVPPTDNVREDGERELTLGSAGVVPSVVKLMTGLRLTLLLYMVEDTRCEINVSFSPAVITALNEYGSATVVVMSELVNFTVDSCFAINRTLPGALNSPAVPETSAVPFAGAVHSSTASFIEPLELCLNPLLQIARYSSLPLHLASAALYVISAPEESLYLQPL